MEAYLKATYFIEKDHPKIRAFSQKVSKGKQTDTDRAVAIYYGVRDQIRYNPYGMDQAKENMRASRILEKKEGYCVAKAVLLAACLRSLGIPARLGFADVKNHLVTGRLKALMQTDLFIWHGYTDVFLEGQWVKATPAFNLSLCKAFKVKPLEFDGISDSIFHPFDARGNRHMEYVRDHGTFADLPFERIMADSIKAYPGYFQNKDRGQADFKAEALKEN